MLISKHALHVGCSTRVARGLRDSHTCEMCCRSACIPCVAFTFHVSCTVYGHSMCECTPGFHRSNWVKWLFKWRGTNGHHWPASPQTRKFGLRSHQKQSQPRRKGTCIHMVYHKYADFTPILYYHAVPPQTIRCDRKQKRERSALILCMFEPLATTLQWHEYHLQQTYVEMPVSLIFEQFVPACFGVTGRRTVIISHSTAHNHLYPPMLALTAHLHVPFHLGGNFIIELTIIQVLDRLCTSI